jgi:hypothetical protein
MMKKYLLCIGVLSTILCLTACNSGTSVSEKPSESKVTESSEEVVDETVYFDDARHWKLKEDGTKYEVSVHKWDDGTIEKEATDDEDGLIVYVCSDCDAEKEEVIPKLKQEETTETTTTAPNVNNTTTTTTNHTHNITDVAFDSDDVFHWKTCSCGEKIEKTKHTWVSKVIEDATETKTGVKRHTCAVCGKTQDETIPKKTHTCSANGTEYEHSNSYHWQVCKCGNKINQEKHKWNSGVVNMTPTETTKTITCTTCGFTKTETVETVAPETPSDDTETETPSEPVTPNEPVVPNVPNDDDDNTTNDDGNNNGGNNDDGTDDDDNDNSDDNDTTSEETT